MYGINILGTGSYIPQLKVTNDDFSKIVDTNDEWITTRTGIKQRGISDGEPTWHMGYEAAKKAVESAGIAIEDIGIIVVSTITGDYSTPSTACLVQRALGADNAFAFDVNAACSGYIFALDIAKRYLETDENLKYALVVSSEVLSKITDYSDRSTCILFGDGAAAIVVERSKDKLYTSHLATEGKGGHVLFAKNHPYENPFAKSENGKDYGDGFPPANKTYIVQNGKEVYKFATKALSIATQKAAEKVNLDINTIDVFVPHQANIRIIETAMKNIGVSMDKAFTNLEMHGNTSSATIPTALDEAIREGRIKRGDKVCLVGFGAGLSYGAIILEY